MIHPHSGQSRSAPQLGEQPIPPARNDVGQDERRGASLDRLSWPARSGSPARILVVLCHGVGANGRQMLRLATAWRRVLPEAAFIAPHAPFPRHTRHTSWLSAAGLRGREWFSLLDRSPEAEEAGTRIAAHALNRCVDDELRGLGLSADKVVLMGFSQGAMTALFAGLRRAMPPRGILGFSGGIPGLVQLAREIRNRAPVLLVHGEADRIVPADRSREAERVLRELDVPVQLLTLPGIGHTINDVATQTGAAFLRRVLA